MWRRPIVCSSVQSRAERVVQGRSRSVLVEALFSLMVICQYGGEEDRWPAFEEAMARTEGIPSSSI